MWKYKLEFKREAKFESESYCSVDRCSKSWPTASKQHIEVSQCCSQVRMNLTQAKPNTMAMASKNQMENQDILLEAKISRQPTKKFNLHCLRQRWWHKWKSVCIISGQAGADSQEGLRLFQFRITVNLFSLAVGLFLIMCNRTVDTLPSSFLFPIIIYPCENYQL